MEDPVVGGYSADKVALRRAISLAYDIDARDPPSSGAARRSPAQAPMPPAHLRLRPGLPHREQRATTRRARKALLDIYGYVDRDGDGWRELPDG